MGERNIPEDATYYFVVSSIAEKFGGMTTAMLKRAKLFWEKAGIPVSVLTFNFNPDYQDQKKDLICTGKMIEPIRLLNIYDFFQGARQQGASEIEEVIDRPFEEPGCTVDSVEGKHAYRLYKNGLYVKYKSYEKENGKLKFIDYFDEHRSRTRREEFDNAGKVRKITYVDLTTNTPKQELFYDHGGHCFLSKWFQIKDGKSKLERINWFDENGEVKQVFKNNDEFRMCWMDHLAAKAHPCFFVVDGRGMDPFILKLPHENVYKIFVKHSIHLRPPYDPYAVLRLGNRPLFKNPGKADGIVFLTNAHKKDVEIRFGERNNDFVIPHSQKRPASFPDLAKRDLKKAVVVSRLGEEKQLDQAIKAFEKVIQQVPDAVLDIYGFGDQEEALQALITKLKLQNNVFLKGRTDNPGEVFEGAAFALLTSKFEGLPLVILECLTHGCPMVAYDIKYGPSDAIQSGENGMLVPSNDIKQLATSMTELFKDPEHLKEMSRAAYESSLAYNEDLFIENWGYLFQILMEQKDDRNTVSSFKFHLTACDWEDKKQGLIQLKGKMKISGKYPPYTVHNAEVAWKFLNRETNKAICFDAEIESQADNEWRVAGEVSVFDIFEDVGEAEGIWEVFLTLTWNNSYVEQRVKEKNQASTNVNFAKAPDKHYIYLEYDKEGQLLLELLNNRKILDNAKEVTEKVIENTGKMKEKVKKEGFKAAVVRALERYN